MTKVRTSSGWIHVRAGQSDIAAVRQVFGNHEHDISWPAASRRVQYRYHEIIAEGGTPVIVDARQTLARQQSGSSSNVLVPRWLPLNQIRATPRCSA